MAATRLIALHKNKGKSVAACLKSRTDYVQNPDKTQQGELVSSYECSPLTVDEEFMLSKRQYELMTGRRQKSDVIAYQIRQSFKPGEITAEEANKVGYELAMRFTKGKYAFIVATHTDREHIHNHIIYNSTALDSTRKFRDFLLSGLAVQRLSDLICLEHQLSVIEIKPYRERQKRTLYPPKESNRDRLCGVIDTILAEKPKDYEVFLQGLEQQGYEVKRGKYTSVKGARQKRFIRFRTLGAGYSEEELKAVISGETEHHPRQKQKRIVPEQKFQMLVDIQAKLAEGKSMGYARWAKRYNLKEMSKTLIFLQEHKIGSIKEMQERVDAATARYHELGDSIKAAEARMAEIAVLRTHEIKTPITAMKLLCENHRTDWTKELLLELEKTNRFTEQALYYARSEHTEKDYSVREMALSQVVHQAIADNKYLLLQGGMRLEVEEMQDTVYSDEKWVRFILNQLIANAVKYRTEQPVLRISTHKRQDQVVLVVKDNGIGIAASDLPRIFEKGFTGQNGRMVQQSTGIGLYLCKRLCEKLGIGITAESSEHGTAISLSFHINCLIHEVQS